MAMPQRNIKPRFEVHPINRMVTETHYRRTEDGVNEAYSVQVPYGYDVYFPAGHSIRVRTDEEMQRLGFMDPPDLIDMDSGDVVGQSQPVSLQQVVMRRAAGATNARKRRQADMPVMPQRHTNDIELGLGDLDDMDTTEDDENA